MRIDNMQRAGAKKDMESWRPLSSLRTLWTFELYRYQTFAINHEHYFEFLLRRSPRSSDLFSRQLALDMTMPATSVPSKRTFKISEILSDKKMSITPENLERRILIE